MEWYWHKLVALFVPLCCVWHVFLIQVSHIVYLSWRHWAHIPCTGSTWQQPIGYLHLGRACPICCLSFDGRIDSSLFRLCVPCLASPSRFRLSIVR